MANSTTTRVLYTPPTDAARYLPEGPRQMHIEGQNCLVWVVIQTAEGTSSAGQIQVAPWPLSPDTVQTIPVPGRIGFILPTTRPNVVIAGIETALELWDLSTGTKLETLAELPDPHPRATLNDAEILPDGTGFVCGTKDEQVKEPFGALYLVTLADRRVSLLADQQTCSNGKVIRNNAGEVTLYDIDTPRECVTAYALDGVKRKLGSGRTVVDFKPEPGLPDGMVDFGDGSAVVAMYNPDVVPAGAALRVDLASGQVLERWVTPGSPRVTCPLIWTSEIGSPSLILTTATEDMPQGDRVQCPNAGALFIAELTGLTAPENRLLRL